MVLGRPILWKVVLAVLCFLTILFLVLITPKELPIEVAMTMVRTAGPGFRGSCLPRGKLPPSNTSIGVVNLNGVKDELYQVSN